MQGASPSNPSQCIRIGSRPSRENWRKTLASRLRTPFASVSRLRSRQPHVFAGPVFMNGVPALGRSTSFSFMNLQSTGGIAEDEPCACHSVRDRTLQATADRASIAPSKTCHTCSGTSVLADRWHFYRSRFLASASSTTASNTYLFRSIF